MKFSGTAVIEIALGVLIGGVLLIAIQGLVGGWIAKHGVEIHGAKTSGEVIK